MPSPASLSLPATGMKAAASGDVRPPARTRFLSLADGRIAYDDAGSGPLVVQVPSLGDLRQEYRLLVPAIVAAGYRAVTMDLRGLGASSAGWPAYTNAAMGRDILALVRSLNAGPAVIVGTSMGAGAAAWAAAEDRTAIAGLVLIGPFVRSVPMRWWKRALMAAAVRVAFAGPWAPAAWGAYYASLYPTAKPADFAAYTAALTANLREPGRMAALKAMLAASKSDVEARLPDVAAPTLVLVGSSDPDFDDPRAEAETVARLLRGRSAVIDGAGHYPHAEMPAATARDVLAFLADVHPRSGSGS